VESVLPHNIDGSTLSLVIRTPLINNSVPFVKVFGKWCASMKLSKETYTKSCANGQPVVRFEIVNSKTRQQLFVSDILMLFEQVPQEYVGQAASKKNHTEFRFYNSTIAFATNQPKPISSVPRLSVHVECIDLTGEDDEEDNGSDITVEEPRYLPSNV